MYQRFRLTPSKTRAVVLWGIAIPVLTYYAAQYTDVSHLSPASIVNTMQDRNADTEAYQFCYDDLIGFAGPMGAARQDSPRFAASQRARCPSS